MKVIRSMVLVSMDEASLERGAEQVFHTFLEEIEEFGLSDQIAVSTIRDVGLHEEVPLVIVYPDAAVYAPVKVEDVHMIVEEHLYKGNIVPNLLALMHELVPEIAWMRSRRGALPVQKRIVLERAGIVDPGSIEDYIVYDGFQALGKSLTQMTPAEVIAEIEKSGLQGRGGAGFPTGRKWSFVASTPGDPKYVICNADESEPGTFKDRLIIEGDPFSVIEAMPIAGSAIGSHHGYIYIRGEYPLAYRRIEHAIQQAEEHGLLGDRILGTDFSFHIHPHAGAGAYICGEETALIESLEAPFEPEKYKDNYRENLQALIQAKVEGRETVEPPAPAHLAPACSSSRRWPSWLRLWCSALSGGSSSRRVSSGSTKRSAWATCRAPWGCWCSRSPASRRR